MTGHAGTHAIEWWTKNIFEISLPHGILVASYYPDIGKMLIASVDVDKNFRRRGIGKQLLELAKIQAAELGAPAIIAAITSRESVDAMISVFGEAAVTINSIGKYDQERLPSHLQTGTDAFLNYHVADSHTEHVSDQSAR